MRVLRRRPGTLAARAAGGRVTVTGPGTYEITFTGQACRTMRAEFDDCQVISGPATTTLRAELPDQCALAGLIQRVIGLRLEITSVLRISPPRPASPP